MELSSVLALISITGSYSQENQIKYLIFNNARVYVLWDGNKDFEEICDEQIGSNWNVNIYEKNSAVKLGDPC